MEIEHGLGSAISMQRIDADGVQIDLSKEIIYTLEVAANRYDLLCLEGISQALRSYLGLAPIPKLSAKNPKMQVIVKPETKAIRPFVVCAILRNIKFDVQSYNSFIDLQDKLHRNHLS